MLGSMRVESSFIDCWSLQSQEILALPLPILACLAFLPCRVSFEHNLAFRASIWGHNTNIDAEMSSAAPRQMDRFASKANLHYLYFIQTMYQWEEKAKETRKLKKYTWKSHICLVYFLKINLTYKIVGLDLDIQILKPNAYNSYIWLQSYQ